MANVLLLTALLTIFLGAIRRWQTMRRIAWSLLLSFLPLLLATSLNAALGKGLSPKEMTGLSILCGLLFLISAFSLEASLFEKFQKAGYVLLLAIAFSGGLLFVEDAWCWMEARHLLYTASQPAPPTHPVPHRSGRIIWIILDELAYKQVFLDRSHDLALPSFDALRAQSTLFTNVIPAADHTELAIPAMVSGVPFKDVAIASDSQHLLERQTAGQWISFDERNSVFADAQAKGYNTAAAGWYIPYCRLLPHAISNCFWSSQFSPLRGLFPTDSILKNIAHPWVRVWRRSPVFWFSPALRSEYRLRENEHLQDYLALSEASNKLLASDQDNFLLLHMPIPHPDGIYDRHRKTYAVGSGSYLDNLALADVYLGNLEKTLEDSHQWDDTTLLVMGDHSWRTNSWQKIGPWTAEDRVASGESYDSRPVYMVKLPHQQLAETINVPYQAVRTRALLDALMDERILTTEELKQWVSTEE